jgi:hypothetical protein
VQRSKGNNGGRRDEGSKEGYVVGEGMRDVPEIPCPCPLSRESPRLRVSRFCHYCKKMQEMYTKELLNLLFSPDLKATFCCERYR